MTLNAIAFSRDKALVVADTASFTGDGEFVGFTSKIATMPHASAAMTARGPLDPFWRAVTRTMIDDPAADADTLAAAMPAILRDAWAEYVAEWAAYGVNLDQAAALEDTAPDTMLDVGLVGWSRSRGAFRGFAFNNIGGADFEPLTFEAPSAMRAPGLADHVRLSREPTEAEMVALTRAEYETAAKWTEAHYGFVAIGGAVEVVTLRPGKVEARMAGKYPNYDALARECEAPVLGAEATGSQPLSRQQRRRMEREQGKARV